MMRPALLCANSPDAPSCSAAGPECAWNSSSSSCYAPRGIVALPEMANASRCQQPGAATTAPCQLLAAMAKVQTARCGNTKGSQQCVLAGGYCTWSVRNSTSSGCALSLVGIWAAAEEAGSTYAPRVVAQQEACRKLVSRQACISWSQEPDMAAHNRSRSGNAFAANGAGARAGGLLGGGRLVAVLMLLGMLGVATA
jgi:hypothetical protein